jgi:hypothetical protein
VEGGNMDGFAIAGVLYGLIYLVMLTVAITVAVGLLALVEYLSRKLLAATWKRLTRTRELQ